MEKPALLKEMLQRIIDEEDDHTLVKIKSANFLRLCTGCDKQVDNGTTK
jgi:hypothetical protein